MAGGAGADAAARVIEAGFDALGDVENAAGYAVVPVGNFVRIDLDGFAAGKKCDFIFLRGRLVFDFFDVGVTAAHFSLLLKSCCAARPCLTGAQRCCAPTQTSASLRPCRAVETALFITNSAKCMVA